MENIDWIAGNEKKFADFISSLNEDKIAIISHIADLDGVCAAKIINTCVDANLIKFIDYQDINEKLSNELKKEKIKFLIISDIMIRDVEFIKKCEKFAKILIIDHHSFETDYNSDRTVFMNAEGYCAAYLSYYLFSKIRNLEKYDWLVACASVSDWCYKKNSSWMISIYEKYKQNFIPSIQGIKESKFYDLVLDLSRAIVYYRSTEHDVRKVFDKLNGGDFGNISDLANYANLVLEEINLNKNKFEKEKMNITDGYYFEFESKFPIKSIISTEVSENCQNKTIIIGYRNGENLEISLRRQDGKIDLIKLGDELIKGFENASAGGHYKAVGGHIQLKDKEEFLKRIKKL